ncbi:MAG: hypothetical protein ACI81P_003705 [Neolewinella sp.]|jgi:hypothetical protein
MKRYSNEFLKLAHKKSIYHETKIVKSNLCGCFYCKETFEPKTISDWTDEGSNKGRTAMCPKCGIDSVLDDEFPIEDNEFLNQMNKFWF